LSINIDQIGINDKEMLEYIKYEINIATFGVVAVNIVPDLNDYKII